MHARDCILDPSVRRTQPHALVQSLVALIDMLALDPNPARPWRRHFIDCLLRARELDGRSGLPQAERNALAGSVMSVYGGTGSFSDYAPLIRTPDGGFALPPGMEDFRAVAGRVYEAALALRVVGDGA